MAQSDILNPHPPEFEPFLYASVGEDRNGYVVTVLSALARLGFDPWKETAALVKLGRGSAQARLGTLLARFRDVPTLARDHGKVAQDLSELLPNGPASSPLKRVPEAVTEAPSGKTRVIGAVLAIFLLLLQILAFGGSGLGE